MTTSRHKTFRFKLLAFAAACALSGTAACHAGQSAWEGVSKVKLDNGVTVVLKENHSQPVVSVQVWVKTGSVDEDEKTSGLSHFLEHLIFKGTKNYPGDEISRLVETQGGVINAATSKEFTYFYIDAYREVLTDAVKILADAMQHITLPENDIEKERPVVLEEIYRHNDNPGALIYDLFTEALFPDTAYKPSVLGSENVIKNITREEIISYYKAHYVPENMFVCIAGDFDTKTVTALINGTFGSIPGRQPTKENQLVQTPHKSIVIRKNKDVEHTYILSGFLGPDVHSTEQFTADIAGMLLGGGRSSRLYNVLREQKQLVYGIGSSFWTQRGTGATAISATLDKKNEKAVFEEIDRQIRDLMNDGPGDEELSRAKEILKSQWIFSNETFHDKAALFGYWLLQGNQNMIDGYLEGIDKTTKDDVKNYFRKYYGGYGLSSAVIAPEK